MPHTLDDFQEQRDAALSDDKGKLGAARRDALLQQAILQRYSKDRPQLLVTDLAGNGTSFLDLPTSSQATWEDGYSAIESIEFPIGTNPPTYLLEEQWQYYRTPTKVQILLTLSAPGNADSLRVGWTARHKADGSTVRDPDFEAVCDYAVGLCYEALAGIYAQTGDPSISADSVNYRTKSQEYLGLAKAAKKRYFDHLGIPMDDKGQEVGPAVATGSIHEQLGVGLDRLTHRSVSR